MNPRGFLLEECKNVEDCLNQTLRFEYGSLDATHFYHECAHRLEAIRKDLNRYTDADLEELGDCSSRLSDLSSLISRLERAHVDEVSWPFAEEVIQLATPLCTETQTLRPRGEASLAGVSHAPLFPILAEGGLSAYRIFTEEHEESFFRSTRRPIHTIIFPRSLKHHVLLHAVIAHEIGHAAMSEPEVAKSLHEASAPLLRSGILESSTKLKEHLADRSAPKSIKEFIRRKLAEKKKNPTDLTEHQLDNWRKEFLCDIIGLLLVGPSFLPAHYTTLRALNPRDSWGPTHPPFYSRSVMLQEICKYLKWSTPITGKRSPASIYAAERAFWSTYLEKKPDWFDFFDRKLLEATVAKLQVFINSRSTSSSVYSHPSPKAFVEVCKSIISAVPPTAAPIDVNGSLQTPKNPIDFRHILFGGWVVWSSKTALRLPEKLNFQNINKLCHLAILQNRAVRIFNDGTE